MLLADRFWANVQRTPKAFDGITFISWGYLGTIRRALLDQPDKDSVSPARPLTRS